MVSFNKIAREATVVGSGLTAGAVAFSGLTFFNGKRLMAEADEIERFSHGAENLRIVDKFASSSSLTGARRSYEDVALQGEFGENTRELMLSGGVESMIEYDNGDTSNLELMDTVVSNLREASTEFLLWSEYSFMAIAPLAIFSALSYSALKSSNARIKKEAAQIKPWRN